MLIAKNEKGGLVTLPKREEAARLRSGRRFFCPACEEPVLIKAGKIRIPHFAHERNTDCADLFTEPESAMHLQGKLDLAELFSRHQYKVELEPYFKEIRQRPDLLLESNDGSRYAVEYQCTPIPARDIRERTDGYKEINIYPLWILGGLPYRNRRHNQFSLTDFQLSILRKDRQGKLGISGYDPHTKFFHHLSNLNPITQTGFTASITSTFIEKLTFPFLSDEGNNAAFPIDRWVRQRMRWLENRIRYGNLINDPFLRTIYEKRLHPLRLPGIIGIPSKNMIAFRSPPVVWQFFLWTDALAHLERGRHFSILYLEQKMRERISRGDVLLRHFPLEPSIDWRESVAGYCGELLKAGFISGSAGRFRLEKPVTAPRNFEEAQKEVEKWIVCGKR